MAQFKDPLRTCDAAQAVLAEILDLRVGGQLIAHQRGGRLGQEHVRTVGRVHEARDSV